MASGYKIAGTDLDSVFKARISTKRADVGYEVGGTDISNRYEKSQSSADWIASNTGYKDNGTDLRQLFMDIAFVLAPAITGQPASGAYNELTSMTLTVTATASPGGGSLSYQWQKWNGSSWSNIGTNSSSYTDGSMALGDAGDYRVIVTDSNGSTTSSTATITVHENPGVVSSPSNVTEYAGTGPYALQCTADGSGTLYFEWFKNGVSQNSPRTGNISATQDQVVWNPIQESDEGTWFCRITNSYGGAPADSSNATVTVNHHAISIVVNPVGFTAADGTGPYALAVNASGGDGDLYFQWFFDDGSGPVALHAAHVGNIDGTHDQHVFNPVTYADAGDYYCRVTDQYGATPVNSTTATVTVI